MMTRFQSHSPALGSRGAVRSDDAVSGRDGACGSCGGQRGALSGRAAALPTQPNGVFTVLVRTLGETGGGVSLGLLLFVVVPGLLAGTAIGWLRRGASQRESRRSANDGGN